MSIAVVANSQGMKIGEVLLVSNSPLKQNVNREAMQNWFTGMASSWNKSKPGAGMYLFLADRGNKKGEYLMVCQTSKLADRAAVEAGSPFTDKSIGASSGSSSKPSDFLAQPGSYTEYHLIGADKLKSLPEIGILGMHYIKVKPERSADFEKFVVEKLHPKVGNLLADLQLLYYKAVAGENTGSYITIFTLASPDARHKYWPAGAPESDLIKQAFKPLNELANELEPFLVSDSYLARESGGGAAIFESKQWTDYVYMPYVK
jgi:hypothetical protein